MRGRHGNWIPKGTDEGTIRTFLRECAEAVHAVAPKMRVSAGSGWHGSENLQRVMYRDLGLNFLFARLNQRVANWRVVFSEN